MKYRILTLVLLLIGCVIWFLSITLPLYYKFNNLLFQVNQLKFEIDNWGLRLNQIQQLENTLAQHTNEVKKIQVAFSSDNAQLAYFLYKVADQNGVMIVKINIKTFQPSEEKSADMWYKRIFLEIIGAPTALKNFFRAVEDSAFLLKIEKLSQRLSLSSDLMVAQVEMITPFYRKNLK